MTTGLRELLPALVEVEQMYSDASACALLPEEDAAVAGAVPGRRAEFVTVRECARRALRRLAQLSSAQPNIAWDRVLFSAKESIFKAWYPLARIWLDFTECELTIDPGSGSFTGRLLAPGPDVEERRIGQFTGRWTIHRSHILTAAWEPVK